MHPQASIPAQNVSGTLAYEKPPNSHPLYCVRPAAFSAVVSGSSHLAGLSFVWPLRCLFQLRHNSHSFVHLTHLKCTIPPSGFLFKRLYLKLLRKQGHKAVDDPQGSQLGRASDRLLPNLGSSGVLPPWCCFQFWIISGSCVGPLHLVFFLAVLPLAFDSRVDWAEIYTKELFSFRVFPGPCRLRLFCDLCTLSKVPVPGAHPAGSGWCVIWTEGAWAYFF